MTVKESKQEITVLPLSETYHLLTGDPEVIGEFTGSKYDTTRGMLTKRMVELTENTIEELGSLGHIVFYDKEDKRTQRKIISVFRRDAVEEVKSGFMGETVYMYPKLYPLYRHFYMASAQEGISRFVINPAILYDLITKKDLKELGLTHDDIVAFQWNSDMALCSMLNVSLLDPELQITAEPLSTQGLCKKHKKASTRLAVFFVRCTHSLIRMNQDRPCSYRGYDPDEVEEYFDRINR